METHDSSSEKNTGASVQLRNIGEKMAHDKILDKSFK